MHRPHFDYEVEARASPDWDTDKIHESYSKGFTEENKAGVVLEPAKDHPDRKWCIVWEGYKMSMDYRRRANCCDPDNFGMYIYNDFPGWGHQELILNFITEFDKEIKKSDEDALKHAWAVVSAMSLWLNEVDQMHLIGNEDGEHTVAVLGLVGWATSRALAALDFAGHLKPDTEFPDVPIVITSLLEFSKDLPEYGIEDEAITWRPHAAAYFQKGKFANEKGIADTKKILETAKGGSAAQLAKKTDKDPWGWNKILKDYKKQHGLNGKIGGHKYDITRMTRAQRASHAFDNKDPLADVSDKDLKEGNLNFA